MNISIKQAILILGLFVFGNVASAGEGHHHFSGDPVKAMAEVIAGLKHFPTKNERKMLHDVMSHSSDENIKIIAGALVNMRHKVTDSDKAKLEKVMNDSTAPDNVRMLAQILHDVNHKPSRDDKQRLSQITGH